MQVLVGLFLAAVLLYWWARGSRIVAIMGTLAGVLVAIALFEGNVERHEVAAEQSQRRAISTACSAAEEDPFVIADCVKKSELSKPIIFGDNHFEGLILALLSLLVSSAVSWAPSLIRRGSLPSSVLAATTQVRRPDV